jgi:signal transduction histidine kinase
LVWRLQSAGAVSNHDDHDEGLDDISALAALCHEVEQPLISLLASLDAVRDALAAVSNDGVAEAIGWIDRARGNGEHIGRLVSDGGPVYRVTSAQRLDLGALVDDTLDLALGEVQRHAELERVLAPSVCVFADGTRLRQVVLSLVMSASQARPADPEARHRIIVRVENVESRAIVEVEDDGPSRALGFGLVLCKRIVHGCLGVIELARGRSGGRVVRAAFPACELVA